MTSCKESRRDGVGRGMMQKTDCDMLYVERFDLVAVACGLLGRIHFKLRSQGT
jgi:hypothetical protein